MDTLAPSPLTRRVIDSLYTEAMLLSDEARTYFDETCLAERDALAPKTRVLFACESVKMTARLTHVIMWLLAARAYGAESARPLSIIALSEPHVLASLPEEARELITVGQTLYLRLVRLEAQLVHRKMPSPVTQLITQISAAF